MEYDEIMRDKPAVVAFCLDVINPNFVKGKSCPEHGECYYEQGIEASLTGGHVGNNALNKMKNLENSETEKFLVQYSQGYRDAQEIIGWTEERKMPIVPLCCRGCDSINDCYAIIYSGPNQMNTKFIKRNPDE